MKWLWLALFAPALAHAQIDGWLSCSHTRTDEKLAVVRVALMGPSDEYSYRTLSGTNLKSQVITFKTAPAATRITGMKLTCSFQMPHLPPEKLNVKSDTMPFAKDIPIAAGVAPKLGVSITETSPGLWRAFIGKAP